jgi:pimeloyl-ACP methyl ester carboxylesterase
MQVIVDGAPIDYSEEGVGPVVVFLHGWRDQKTTWRPLIDLLKPKFRCVALDLPNFGASAENVHCNTPEQYATNVAAVLKKIGITDYSLVGHSMGGQIAVYGTGTGILQPKQLFLIAAAGVRQKTTKKHILHIGAKVTGKVFPSQVKQSIYNRLGSDYDVTLSPALKKVLAAMLATDVIDVARHVTQPTLLIYGEIDLATPPAYGKLFHQAIPRSKYIELKGADHWLHQKAAPTIAEHMKDHL